MDWTGTQLPSAPGAGGANVLTAPSPEPTVTVSPVADAELSDVAAPAGNGKAIADASRAQNKSLPYDGSRRRLSKHSDIVASPFIPY
jgi:hypothetical protein